jgi:hypothetical protein
VGLTTAKERSQLAQLPVLMSNMGEIVKDEGPVDRPMMWAYTALRHIPVSR